MTTSFKNLNSVSFLFASTVLSLGLFGSACDTGGDDDSADMDGGTSSTSGGDAGNANDGETGGADAGGGDAEAGAEGSDENSSADEGDGAEAGSDSANSEGVADEAGEDAEGGETGAADDEGSEDSDSAEGDADAEGGEEAEGGEDEGGADDACAVHADATSCLTARIMKTGPCWWEGPEDPSGRCFTDMCAPHDGDEAGCTATEGCMWHGTVDYNGTAIPVNLCVTPEG